MCCTDICVCLRRTGHAAGPITKLFLPTSTSTKHRCPCSGCHGELRPWPCRPGLVQRTGSGGVRPTSALLFWGGAQASTYDQEGSQNVGARWAEGSVCGVGAYTQWGPNVWEHTDFFFLLQVINVSVVGLILSSDMNSVLCFIQGLNHVLWYWPGYRFWTNGQMLLLSNLFNRSRVQTTLKRIIGFYTNLWRPCRLQCTLSWSKKETCTER